MKRTLPVFAVLLLLLFYIPAAHGAAVTVRFVGTPTSARFSVPQGTAITGMAGYYSMPGDGDYEFTASYDNYVTKTGSFTIIGGKVYVDGVECAENTIHVALEEMTYPVVIACNPAGLKLTILNGAGTELTSYSSLKKGLYLYRASAPGYENGAGSFSVEGATSLSITLKALTQTQPTTSDIGALILSPQNVDGSAYVAPLGKPGDKVKLKLPVMNKGGALTSVSIEPVVSANVEEFPFVAESVNYGRILPDLYSGQTAVAEYTFTISPYATTGTKPVKFHAVYRENGILTECTFAAPVTVKDGYVAPLEDLTPAAAPKLMMAGYKLSKDGLYAGDAFDLTLQLKNTSKTDTVYDVAAALTLDISALVITGGNSDACYIGKIAPGDTAEVTYHLRSMPDILGNASIALNMTYKNQEDTPATASQTIVLPIRQKMRVQVDPPTVYDDKARQGSPVAVNLGIINKGKTKAYNVEVNVQSDSIVMKDGFYGGDVLPAAKLSADFEVISLVAGEAQGKLIVSYEDAEGQIYEQSVDIALQTLPEEEEAPAQTVMQPMEQPPEKGLPPLAYGGIAAGMAAVAALIIIRLRRGRRRG